MPSSGRHIGNSINLLKKKGRTAQTLAVTPFLVARGCVSTGAAGKLSLFVHFNEFVATVLDGFDNFVHCIGAAF
jgi:hypothetical protein